MQPLDPAWGEGQKKLKGYLVGDRFISDAVRVDPDPARLIDQTIPVYCVEPGLERFARGGELLRLFLSDTGPLLVASELLL